MVLLNSAQQPIVLSSATAVLAGSLHLVPFMQNCSAGDSAAYQRRNSSLDDVVIVAARRTPLTKVGTVADSAASPLHSPPDVHTAVAWAAPIARHGRLT